MHVKSKGTSTLRFFILHLFNGNTPFNNTSYDLKSYFYLHHIYSVLYYPMYQSSYNFGGTKMFKKANRMSLVEQVVSQIEHLIESGHWSVGDRLPPEMELMKEFDVSRNTLREAIRALVHAGLLETKQGSGTIVKSTSALGVALHRQVEKSNLYETLEVRLALEREAAQLAALRRNEEDLQE